MKTLLKIKDDIIKSQEEMIKNLNTQIKNHEKMHVIDNKLIILLEKEVRSGKVHNK